jgi:hypothetical protein
MSEVIKGKVDLFLEKIVSRKLFVFLISTVFMLSGIIPSETWSYFASIYIGVQGMVDFAKVWKN